MKNIFIIIVFGISYFVGYLFGYIDGYFKFHNSLCEYNNLSSLEIGSEIYCTDGKNIIDLKLIKLGDTK